MLLQGATAFVKEGKGSQFLEALDDLNLINKMTSPRTLNTHLPYRWLPCKHLENDGKIVHVVRNPKDVAVSMFFHFKETGEFVGSEIIDFDDRVNGMLSDAPSKFLLAYAHIPLFLQNRTKTIINLFIRKEKPS